MKYSLWKWLNQNYSVLDVLNVEQHMNMKMKMNYMILRKGKQGEGLYFDVLQEVLSQNFPC